MSTASERSPWISGLNFVPRAGRGSALVSRGETSVTAPDIQTPVETTQDSQSNYTTRFGVGPFRMTPATMPGPRRHGSGEQKGPDQLMLVRSLLCTETSAREP